MDKFAERLARLKIKHYRDLMIVLSTFDSERNGMRDFSLILQLIVGFTDITPVQLADGAQVSEGSLARWITRTDSPQPIIRKTTVIWILGELKQRAKTIEDSLGQYLAPEVQAS